MKPALIVVGIALAAASAALAQTTDRARLQLVDRAPLVVRGAAFEPRERVRLDLSGVATIRRRVLATRYGTFKLAFDDVVVTRCDLIRVVAVGSGGSRAVLKLLPAPACNPG